MKSTAPLLATPPQYVLVAQQLMDDIQAGRHPVGSLLPTEFTLCTQFGVSRHTVREAIRRLQERGLVTRQRGVGTTVKAPPAESAYVQTTAVISNLPQYVEDTRLVTSETIDLIADEALATRLGCPAGQRWLKVTGLRYTDRGELPMALTDVYINGAYGGVRKHIDASQVPIYTLLEKHYGITIVEVQQEIRATTIGPADAKRLTVEPGSAGLLLTRRYLSERNQLIEVAVNLYPADRFAYVSSVRLQVGPERG